MTILFVATDADGKSETGSALEVDWTAKSAGTKITRTLDRKASVRQRSWLNCYRSLDQALLLSPMHEGLINPRIFEVTGYVRAADGTTKNVTDELTASREIAGPTMDLATRVSIAKLCGERYLASHAGWLAWLDYWEKDASKRRLSAVEEEKVIKAVAAWVHQAQYQARRQQLSFDLEEIIREATL